MMKIHTIERPPMAMHAICPPLLLMLHGYGSNEQDLIGLAPYLDSRLHIISARAPYNVGFGYAWYHLDGAPGALEQDDASMHHTLDGMIEWVKNLLERTPTKTCQFYLFGFSQGAVMSLNIAMLMPEYVAGVVVISGYLDQSILPRVQPDTFQNLEVLILHGTYDDVIPVAGGRAIRDYLYHTPAYMEYHEYPMGHGIHPDALPVLQRWFRERLGDD